MRSVMVVCLLAACDPGGGYRLRGGSELGEQAREYALAGPAQTELRARASWFTATLWVDLTIINKGSSALVIAPTQMRVADRTAQLEWKSGPPSCEARAGDSVTLAPGDACVMKTSLRAIIDKDRLETITVHHDGVTRDGAPVPIVVQLDLD